MYLYAWNAFRCLVIRYESGFASFNLNATIYLLFPFLVDIYHDFVTHRAKQTQRICSVFIWSFARFHFMSNNFPYSINDCWKIWSVSVFHSKRVSLKWINGSKKHRDFAIQTLHIVWIRSVDIRMANIQADSIWCFGCFFLLHYFLLIWIIARI